jgi:acetyl-CoA carboxylase carboxyltransferase component
MSGGEAIVAALQGTVVSLDVQPGDRVRRGQVIGLIESMKMHHEIVVATSGSVVEVHISCGSTVVAGQVIVEVHVGGEEGTAADDHHPVAVGGERADLAEVVARHQGVLDVARPAAVARRREAGRRTARENIADLVDEGSLVEIGPMVVAAQRRRRSEADLIANTPADGMVGGLATVNARRHPGRDTRCVVVSYDYTVLAGTQGTMNHQKKDRLFELAERLRVPVVFFTEGGGGRPGDTDGTGVTGLDCLAFRWFAELSGLVPLVGINAGYCFAGNAAILGCCDVVIATVDSHIGMGGPAMIEGGGLGVVAATDIGPIDVQRANGVVDIVAADEAEAVAIAQCYLSYFQGDLDEWSCVDQALAREVVPRDRMRAYDIRRAIEVVFDSGSVLELRRDFGIGMVTVLARIEGRPVGVLANDPAHLGGAIDSDGADKAARFMQLCDAFGLPLVTLCDTPGMMVGPQVEETALVRHCSRLFVTGANLSVPMVAVVLRKAYGLGAQAMMGGSTKSPLACVAWPTGEFGGMGLEGAVRLGYRKELDAAADDEVRDALYRNLVDRLYEHGKALSVATHFEIDDVIDPADTRRWITSLLAAAPGRSTAAKRRPNIDTW